MGKGKINFQTLFLKFKCHKMGMNCALHRMFPDFHSVCFIFL